MKKMHKLAMIAVGSIILLASCEKYPPNVLPRNETQLETRASVTPVLVDPWTSGNASFECQEAGACGDWAYKIDNWSETGQDGTYSDPNAAPGTGGANEIVITSSDAYTFSWSSTYVVCKVIVKGGRGANVYYYPEGSCGDENLVAPLNDKSPDTKMISHATFCWSNTLCEQPPAPCYQDETAWAAGKRYVTRGNWATYTTYQAGQSVPIYAGQTLPAGVASFSPPVAGMVTITITLNPNFIFYYDLTDPKLDFNIKIQDYASTPPAKNPAPGLFAWKTIALFSSHSATVVVPEAMFYGIHLDVAYETACK